MIIAENDRAGFYVTFQPVPAVEFHEVPVVINAIGSQVATMRHNPVERNALAHVGGLIMPLKTTDESGEKEDTVALDMDGTELEIMAVALHGYSEERTVQADIAAAAMGGNFRSCIVRTIEANIAREMYGKIIAEIGELTTMHVLPTVGFTIPGQQ